MDEEVKGHRGIWAIQMRARHVFSEARREALVFIQLCRSFDMIKPISSELYVWFTIWFIYIVHGIGTAAVFEYTSLNNCRAPYGLGAITMLMVFKETNNLKITFICKSNKCLSWNLKLSVSSRLRDT